MLTFTTTVIKKEIDLLIERNGKCIDKEKNGKFFCRFLSLLYFCNNSQYSFILFDDE